MRFKVYPPQAIKVQRSPFKVEGKEEFEIQR